MLWDQISSSQGALEAGLKSGITAAPVEHRDQQCITKRTWADPGAGRKACFSLVGRGKSDLGVNGALLPCFTVDRFNSDLEVALLK